MKKVATFAANFILILLVLNQSATLAQNQPQPGAQSNVQVEVGQDQSINLFTPGESRTGGYGYTGKPDPYPRGFVPYNPGVNMTHPGYWIPVTNTGFLQKMYETFASRGTWTLADAEALYSGIERSEKEVRKLFDIRVQKWGPAGSPLREMRFIDNYEPGDFAEFKKCFRIVGKSRALGRLGKKIGKVDCPVDSEEVSGRALAVGFKKSRGTFFYIEAEGAPMQMCADSNQKDIGFSIGQVGGPGSGTRGAFIGGMWHNAWGASWPLQVPFYRLVYCESTGRKYIPRSIREAEANAKAKQKAIRTALLQRLSSGEITPEQFDQLMDQVQGRKPVVPPDPRIIQNSGQ